MEQNIQHTFVSCERHLFARSESRPRSFTGRWRSRLRSVPDPTSLVRGAAGIGGFESSPGAFNEHRAEADGPEDSAPIYCAVRRAAPVSPTALSSSALGSHAAVCYARCPLQPSGGHPSAAQCYSTWKGLKRSPSLSCDVPSNEVFILVLVGSILSLEGF